MLTTKWCIEYDTILLTIKWRLPSQYVMLTMYTKYSAVKEILLHDEVLHCLKSECISDEVSGKSGSYINRNKKYASPVTFRSADLQDEHQLQCSKPYCRD